jgi:hypothetical protein
MSKRYFTGLVIAANDEQLLAWRGIPPRRIIVHAGLSRTFMPSTMAYRCGPPLWMTLPHTKPNSHWPRCPPAPQLRRKRPLSEFGLRVEIKKKKQRGGYARAAPRQGLGFPNPNRGHASDTSDARTSGGRGDIAFPNRSAGCHNRSSPCNSDAPGTQAGRY